MSNFSSREGLGSRKTVNRSITLEKRWVLLESPDPEIARRLQAQTGLSPLVCRLLAQRGIVDIDAARAFLAPKLEHLHDPFLMKGVREVVDRLLEARRRGERIGIHGDYDVDGITSTTLYTQVLRSLGFDVVPFVPHRMIDGYGVSIRALGAFQEQGITLVLTCDTGFSAVEEVRHAIDELGLHVLITDHHTPPEVLPKAHALVNPRQRGCNYPFKELSGVGVAFKVLQGLVRALKLNEKDALFPYLDLVALGTVCDVVPLIGENRVLVKWGLRVARETRNLGLRTLLETVSVPLGQVDEYTFGWIVGPRLNAAGRIDDAAKALELLICEDPARAKELATEIDMLNVARRSQTQKILDSAIRLISQGPPLEDLWGIVLFDDGTLDCEWHHGVIGIVASKIVERYGRAAFLFGRDEKSGKWKGSGRAPAKIATVNLFNALSACAEHLLKFGGHAAAAGATLKAQTREELEAFAAAFNEAMKAQMRPEDRTPTLYADLEARLEDLTPDLWDILRRFAPFGHHNEPIQMIARDVEVIDVRTLGKEGTHLKLRLRQGNTVMDALGWGFVDLYPEVLRLGRAARVDILFQLTENVYRGTWQLQLELKDLKIRDYGESAGPLEGGHSKHDQLVGAGCVHDRYAPRNLFA